MIERFLHVRYRVSNLEKAIYYFVNFLGLQEVGRIVSPRGSKLVFLKAPESECLLELCEFPDSGKVIVPPDLTHLAFSVKDLEEARIKCNKMGWPFTDSVQRAENGLLFTFIDAPDGYEIELIQEDQKDNKKE
ncbi:VOC family protein [Methylacidiphilum caldifontis]|uniref:Glyoxalase n=1 Tax=Methylacidiphilum caldifontis TaxID=2795386 RepID=A0A4Y8PHF3_9BACT|nr:VOC family protein [Methylacidiphilum caldifontis]QSR88563.1 VOC family protein [Methylacidiphilum caldifontis]TFE72049.1 glyoxalase [Methylacidiphilum caldifontis]